MAVIEVELSSIDDTVVVKYPCWWTVKVLDKHVTTPVDPLDMFNTVGVKVTDAPPLFDGHGDYIRITKEVPMSMPNELKYVWNACPGGGMGYGAEGLLGEPTFRGTIAKDRWTKVDERCRTYYFANDVTASVDCPAWLWVSSSGTHYIKDSCGRIHILNKSWVRITIEGGIWTQCPQ